ncbi:hypothetical protein CFC21_103095 [Triticum aestivum]|uniref:Uncharacterized protein n=2 Tax=Triticum aestivum TaxID=4565 RepID=A0A9R1N5W9_WHEAT|nr:proline-, glutamic acid- and leucine-rich protein 1-like [Triticum aestivum]KAF7101879.1 hypothetical protein CFC21_103095 [Triticum aestivum]
MSGGGRKPVGDDAEVEALLRAAQDAVLLKLQANSHLVSSSSSAASNPLALDEGPGPLDDDLARRLDALRSRPAPPKRPGGAPTPAAGGMDEMEARFAALKGAAVCPDKETRVRLEDLGGESDEEDEVEKVMRWAMDAARLDVATAGGGASNADHKEEEDKSSNAEDKEEEDKSSASSEDEEERLELEETRKEKEMMSKKNKAKSRWFFF